MLPDLQLSSSWVGVKEVCPLRAEGVEDKLTSSENTKYFLSGRQLRQVTKGIIGTTGNI